MYKVLIVAVMLLFAGCSNMSVNKQMCDKIAKDPQSVLPQECIPYIEEEAAKASLDQDEKITPKESIEVTKE